MGDTSSSFEKNAQSLQSWWEDAQLAFVFLTRIPWKITNEVPDQALNRAVRTFPLIGLMIGGIAATVFSIAHLAHLPEMVCALLAIMVCVIITGALHEDGLADVVDGFGGGFDKDKKLEIMRDSRTGAYGVLALIFSVGLRVFCLAGFENWHMAAASLVGVSALSRLGPVILLYNMDPARTDGLAAKMEKPDQVIVGQGVFVALAIFMLAAPFDSGWLALLFSALALFGFKKLAQSQVGGHTGDICGSAQQIIETTALLVLVAASS